MIQVTYTVNEANAKNGETQLNQKAGTKTNVLVYASAAVYLSEWRCYKRGKKTHICFLGGSQVLNLYKCCVESILEVPVYTLFPRFSHFKKCLTN